MRQRTIVCPLIENEGHYLLCKMAADRGVFPGQWALSGGGVEPGERIEEACGGKYAKSLAKNSSLPISRRGAFAMIPVSKLTRMVGRKRSI
ncbi:pyrimidine deoxynucleoside triphosphate (dYTP) pyrophosphohydrolase YfoO [Klebsiella pneumoniae]|nr:pyrimidine deoxynucleoside triphosphate (dYTP) pyrophosphohydrolase YfoO [Klebsiella pneumoniae]